VTRARGTAALGAWLTLVWVGLWGSVTAANVLGGLAVAAALLVLLRPEPSDARAVVAPLALLRFSLRFAADLVVSSLQVVRLVLRPRTDLRQGVVSVRVPEASDTLLTLLADAISLTPGTLTLDVDRVSATLYVHCLDVGDGPEAVERLRADLRDQAAAAVRAVGSDAARRHLGAAGAGAGDRRREAGR
jgi:multicomponent Na+:H+ antiporter subunit E